MTTPTKEQIDDIIYEHLPMCIWGIMIAKLDIDERRDVVESICLCWEKIRNSHK